MNWQTSHTQNIAMLRSFSVLYILVLTAIVIGADIGFLNPVSIWLHRVPFGDKLCHFVFVGMLSFLLSASFSVHLKQKRKRFVVFSTIITLVVLTSLEEMSQTMLVYRSFSRLDMLANISGTCLFGSLALLFPIRWKKVKPVSVVA